MRVTQLEIDSLCLLGLSELADNVGSDRQISPETELALCGSHNPGRTKGDVVPELEVRRSRKISRLADADAEHY